MGYGAALTFFAQNIKKDATKSYMHEIFVHHMLAVPTRHLQVCV